MTTENNVTDICKRLNKAQKERDREDGVLFCKDFAANRSDIDCPTHIEVYEGGGYVDAGLCVTIDKTSTVILLTVDEAIELGEAILLAACRGRDG